MENKTMNNPNCPLCGGETKYREGKNKAGKDYKGYFCIKDNQVCNGVSWVSDTKKKPYASKTGQTAPNITPKDAGYNNLATQHKELRNLIYIALWKLGMTNRDIQDDLEAIKDGRK